MEVFTKQENIKVYQLFGRRTETLKIFSILYAYAAVCVCVFFLKGKSLKE